MANCRLLVLPLLLCAAFAGINHKGRASLKKAEQKPFPTGHTCSAVQMKNDLRCSIPRPPENPPLLTLPAPESRAARTRFLPFADFPDEACKRKKSCPVTILATGENKSLGLDLIGHFFNRSAILNSTDIQSVFANGVYGSVDSSLEPKGLGTVFVDPALLSPYPINNLQSKCGRRTRDSRVSITSLTGTEGPDKEIKCVQGLSLWRNSSSDINNQLLKGYFNGTGEEKTNEIVAAYNFLNSNNKKFNVSIWYNFTVKEGSDSSPESMEMMGVPRLINLVSNAYLEFLRGPNFKILLKFVKAMPKHPSSQPFIDSSTMGGTVWFTWIVLQLFPIILGHLVYEKQENIRTMMKMHGLGDGPYWVICYIYFLTISSAYMLGLVASGSFLGLEIFTAHDYSLQFVFYFVYLNLQIAFSFLLAGIFNKVRNATVVAYLLVLASGLVGSGSFQRVVDDESSPRIWITAMESFPGISLYRIFYEFSLKARDAKVGHTTGMTWKDLNDRTTGLKEVLIIMVTEWFLFLFVSYCIDKKSTLFRVKTSSSQMISLGAFDQVEKADVAREREKVEELLVQPDRSYSIICDDMKKVYPGKDGNPAKVAVKGLSLALRHGECFGVLGPNGAGKSTFLNMMIGLTKPSSGTAFVEGLNIESDMDRVYNSMGVCPQHDLLWETLTAREHLLFYGRLKNLKGAALNEAVEKSLGCVNLLKGGVADKKAGRYSRGMKRRLSVAISLIGDPKVVYMDEPSTGLDPASRKQLWDVVMRAKMNRAIILTTHSMEEAEHLCDRLGIFVDGSLECIGNAKQLKARYGGFYVFTVTTSCDDNQEVERLIIELSPSANKTYHISGTQKYDLPKNEVTIADVFEYVETLKNKFDVKAWDLADSTLEDVFIQVACGAQAVNDVL